MQCRDGGWAAFDVDNFQTLCRELPLLRLRRVDRPIRAPTSRLTFLKCWDRAEHSTVAVHNGVAWLLRSPRRRRIVVRALGCELHLRHRGRYARDWSPRAVSTSNSAIRRGVDWLEAHQNEDGGWGEDLRSYRDPAYRGRGASTPSQTAWALTRPPRGGRALGVTGARYRATWSTPRSDDGIVGRAVVHRNRIPAATSTSTTTSTDWSSP